MFYYADVLHSTSADINSLAGTFALGGRVIHGANVPANELKPADVGI